MNENEVTARCRIVAGRMKTVLLRNNIGAYQDQRGHWVQYGVGGKGAGDFIGWKMVEITPDMVGQKIAQFVSVEFKRTNGGRITQKQEDWVGAVTNAGGRAGIVSSESEIAELLKD
jgi:hypothetical protein